MATSVKTIVLGVTGSISAFKAAEIASYFTKAGHRVEVIMTKEAGEFIGAMTFRNITHRPVVTTMWDLSSEFSVEHVALAEAADVVLHARAVSQLPARRKARRCARQGCTRRACSMHKALTRTLPAPAAPACAHPTAARASPGGWGTAGGACALRGAAQLLEKVCEKTGVKPGAGPSPDGMWSVEEVECLAGCGVAPCIQVNHDVYDELVDERKLIEVMEACKRGEYRPWAQ